MGYQIGPGVCDTARVFHAKTWNDSAFSLCFGAFANQMCASRSPRLRGAFRGEMLPSGEDSVMAHWTYWEWVAYAVLFIAALIIAADTGFKQAPELMEKLPAFFHSTWWGFAPLAFVLLATVILVGREFEWFGRRSPAPEQTSAPQIIDTNLFLLFSDAHSVPIEKNPRNIRSWYALYTESIYVDTKDKDGNSLGGFSVPPRWSISILFDKPPIFRQLVATCRGPNNPKCDVNFSNVTYAIVTIVGDVTSSTLDISIIR